MTFLLGLKEGSYLKMNFINNRSATLRFAGELRIKVHPVYSCNSVAPKGKLQFIHHFSRSFDGAAWPTQHNPVSSKLNSASTADLEQIESLRHLGHRRWLKLIEFPIEAASGPAGEGCCRQKSVDRLFGQSNPGDPTAIRTIQASSLAGPE